MPAAVTSLTNPLRQGSRGGVHSRQTPPWQTPRIGLQVPRWCSGSASCVLGIRHTPAALVFLVAPRPGSPPTLHLTTCGSLRQAGAGPSAALLRPAPDEIHHLIPHVMRHPGLGQSSPRLFFNAMCSAINSAKTSSLVCTFFSKNSIRGRRRGPRRSSGHCTLGEF